MEDQIAAIYLELTKHYSTRYAAKSVTPPGRVGTVKDQLYSADYVLTSIRDAVVDLEIKANIRPDAVHFLLMNFHQMIMLPLLAKQKQKTTRENHPSPVVLSGSELKKAVDDDIHLILSYAKEKANGGEITGHGILDAAGRAYEKLRTGKLEIWG